MRRFKDAVSADPNICIVRVLADPELKRHSTFTSRSIGLSLSRAGIPFCWSENQGGPFERERGGAIRLWIIGFRQNLHSFRS